MGLVENWWGAERGTECSQEAHPPCGPAHCPHLITCLSGPPAPQAGSPRPSPRTGDCLSQRDSGPRGQAFPYRLQVISPNGRSPCPLGVCIAVAGKERKPARADRTGQGRRTRAASPLVSPGRQLHETSVVNGPSSGIVDKLYVCNLGSPGRCMHLWDRQRSPDRAQIHGPTCPVPLGVLCSPFAPQSH